MKNIDKLLLKVLGLVVLGGVLIYTFGEEALKVYTPIGVVLLYISAVQFSNFYGKIAVSLGALAVLGTTYILITNAISWFQVIGLMIAALFLLFLHGMAFFAIMSKGKSENYFPKGLIDPEENLETFESPRVLEELEELGDYHEALAQLKKEYTERAKDCTTPQESEDLLAWYRGKMGQLSLLARTKGIKSEEEPFTEDELRYLEEYQHRMNQALENSGAQRLPELLEKR